MTENNEEKYFRNQKIPVSADSTKLYKNIIGINSDFSGFKECASMVDLTCRIASLTSAILLLFEFVLNKFFKPKKESYVEGITMLRERPGLQNITYSARYDLTHNDEFQV